MMMMKTIGIAAISMATIFISGCLTMSGDYKVTAVDQAGKPIMEKSEIYAEGRMIYTMRNAICANNPGATVHITDIHSGKELKSESPYKCR